MSETGSDTRSGIGARLRAGREKMGLTQLQAAEKLHVDPKVVESLEGERYDVLGAPVFVRGHLKRYAELIGEQGAQLLELYSGTTKPALPDLTRLPKAAPETKPSRLAVPALVVLIGFVLVGIVWWIAKSVGGPSGSDGAAKPKRGPQPVAIAPTTPDAEAAEAAANAVAPSAASSDTTATNVPAGPSPISAANKDRSRDAPAPRATGAGVPGAAAPNTQASNTSPRGPAAAGGAPSPIAAANNERTTASPAASGGATPAARGAKPMEVTLRFAADSWVEVYDANGAKLFYDVGSASSSRTVSGTPPFRVTVANAPGVTLDVNGKPAAVPANALKGDEAQFLINRSGRIVRAPPKADGG